MKKRCCFSGHRNIFREEDLSKKITEVAERLILDEDVQEFFVGGYGKFDNLVATSVSKLRKKHPQNPSLFGFTLSNKKSNRYKFISRPLRRNYIGKYS